MSSVLLMLVLVQWFSSWWDSRDRSADVVWSERLIWPPRAKHLGVSVPAVCGRLCSVSEACRTSTPSAAVSLIISLVSWRCSSILCVPRINACGECCFARCVVLCRRAGAWNNGVFAAVAPPFDPHPQRSSIRRLNRLYILWSWTRSCRCAIFVSVTLRNVHEY